MNPSKLLVIISLGSALLLKTIGSGVAVGAERHVSERGTKAADHMGEKGVANGNAQWSADPEKGWVRAEKRHKLHDQRGTPSESNRQFGKAKGQRKTD